MKLVTWNLSLKTVLQIKNGSVVNEFWIKSNYFWAKKILQNLLKLLDEQYNLVLNKDVIALGKIAEDIEEEGKS